MFATAQLFFAEWLLGTDTETNGGCMVLVNTIGGGNTSLAEEWIKRAQKAGAKTSEITMRIMKDRSEVTQAVE